MTLSLLDTAGLVGTFFFAASGARLGVRKGFDLLGVLVLGCVTAVGGGSLRDLLLGHTPPVWFRDERLLWAAIRQATARWVDSQLWLVERNAAWINQAEPGDSTPLNAAAPTAGLVEHLAAQLVVALKPFAGNLVTSVQ